VSGIRGIWESAKRRCTHKLNLGRGAATCLAVFMSTHEGEERRSVKQGQSVILGLDNVLRTNSAGHAHCVKKIGRGGAWQKQRPKNLVIVSN